MENLQINKGCFVVLKCDHSKAIKNYKEQVMQNNRNIIIKGNTANNFGIDRKTGRKKMQRVKNMFRVQNIGRD